MENTGLNIFGEPLATCSSVPLTGFLRDGCCNTNEVDFGMHTVCAVVTKDFLQFSYEQGNDLITPRPEYNFDGLMPGDSWCLCASRWLDAHLAGKAPEVLLEATNEKTLDLIPKELLLKYAVK
jgi:uncharacterized protein (DUF2237 family)